MVVSEKIKKLEIKLDDASSDEVKTDQSRDIGIWLDTYDDLFSDFDPRSFSERNISDDFLNELRKVSKENDFYINELRLLIPEKNREPDQEIIISKRIHSFFRKNIHVYQHQERTQKRNAMLFVFIAIAMMVGASYVSLLKSENILMHTLLVILEPAGWFLIWTGLDDLLSLSRKEMPELNFYTKLSKCKIVFRTIS